MHVVSSDSGTSGVLNLLGYERTDLVHAQANTNLLHPRTVIPTLVATLEPGIHWLASAIVGIVGIIVRVRIFTITSITLSTANRIKCRHQ